MSDLISRSELLTSFNNKNIQIIYDLPVEEVLGEDVDLDDFAMLVQDAIQAYKKMVIDIIKNHPTAYDPDEVVKELENELEKGNIAIDFGEFRLFEIVKHGGVSDDVCEWKMTDTKKLMSYETSCGNEDLYDNSYKYCPYCGKKILCKE